MKRFIAALIVAVSLPVYAGALLTWTLPNTHVNGSVLVPQSSDVLTLTKDSGTPITLSGTATTYTDTSVADCTLHKWSLTFTESATALKSDPSTATQPIDTVGCAPKPVTGLTAK